MSDTTNTTGLRERLLAEAKTWPRSDISGLLKEAAAALSPPALEGMDDPMRLVRGQAHAWEAVVAALDKAAPDWNHADGTCAMDRACKVIERLAAPVAAQAVTDGGVLLDALHEGRRAIGDHYAPDDCYATGPMTGDPIRDLVQCPACSFIAMYDAALAHPNAAPCDAQGASNGR